MFYVYESQLALCMCLSLLRLLAHYVSHTARIMCFGTIVWCSTGWSIACIERWRNIFVYSCVHVVYVYVSLCSLDWRYVLHGNWTTKRHKYSEPSGTLNTTSRHTVKCNFFNIIIVINIITHPLQLKLDSLSLFLSFSLTHARSHTFSLLFSFHLSHSFSVQAILKPFYCCCLLVCLKC